MPGGSVVLADGEMKSPAVRPEGRRKTDLPVRAASAIIMLAIAAFALWQGGWVLDLLIIAVAGVTLWEWQRLVRRWQLRFSAALLWLVAGAFYIGTAAWLAVAMDAWLFVFALGVTVMTDTGAYFTGRAIGGPKIAPRISPSKTWAGLVGGMIGAAAWCCFGLAFIGSLAASLTSGNATHGLGATDFALAALIGAVLAVSAQAGDFFESWMKRRAKVKDSSTLIPGHGGLFDRTDGMLPVLLLIGLLHEIVL